MRAFFRISNCFIIFSILFLLIISTFITSIGEDFEESNQLNDSSSSEFYQDQKSISRSTNNSYELMDIIYNENQTNIIEITLPANVVIKNVTLEIRPNYIIDDLKLIPSWDFSIVNKPFNEQYPSDSDFSTHPFLYAGYNGSSLFRFLMGWEIPQNFSFDFFDSYMNLYYNDLALDQDERERIEDRIYSIMAVEDTNESTGSTWLSKPNYYQSNPIGEFNASTLVYKNIQMILSQRLLDYWEGLQYRAIWMMVEDDVESSLSNPTRAVFHSREHPDNETRPELTFRYLSNDKNFSMAWWLDDVLEPPDNSWFRIKDLQNTKLTFDTLTFKNYLKGLQVNEDGNAVVPLKIAFNRSVAFDYLALNVSYDTLDADGDGITDDFDDFPLEPTQWKDSDGDGYGDNISGKYPDAFPSDPTQYSDADGDGFGDNNSGNDPDAFPNDPTQWLDTDEDGYGDNQEGNDPDEYPRDNDLWNPMQDLNNYKVYNNDVYNFKIKTPASWDRTTDTGGTEIISYNFKVKFAEPQGYTANAVFDIKVVDDLDTENTKGSIQKLMNDILGIMSKTEQSFSIITNPTYKMKDDRWQGEAQVQYTENDIVFTNRIFVTVSEYHNNFYILSSKASSDKYSNYASYFNRIEDSFEITGELDDLIIGAICAGVVIIIIIVVIAIVIKKYSLGEKRKEPGLSTKPADYSLKDIEYRIPASPKYEKPARTQEISKRPRRTIPIKTDTGTQLCSTCGGTARCVECEGMGTVEGGIFGQNINDCPNCSGKGMCPSCRPNYYDE
jgi:hypothetical protein